MQNTYRANHQLRFELKPRSWRGVLDTTLCDKVCQWLATGRWFSLISSTNKNDCHDIAEILMKMALNTISQTPSLSHDKRYSMILSCHDEGNDLQINTVILFVIYSLKFVYYWYCVVFLFCLSSSCVPYVDSFPVLYFFECPSVFSNVYLELQRTKIKS
jgi:hypothetical protein